MSWRGGPAPPIVLWMVFAVVSNILASYALQNGQPYWAYITWGVALLLIIVTFLLWKYKHWNF